MLYNRTENPSPFEKLYGDIPRTENIRSFGEICYIYVPEQKRNFKFEPVRQTCRFLGFANDDAQEIMNAYVVPKENSGQIAYSNDVVFLSKPEF